MSLKGTPMHMKAINKKRVLQCIRQQAPISRAEISAKLHISKPTVSVLVDELIDDRWVYEQGIGESSSQGGRRPIQLYFNEKAAYIAGVDIGGTKVRIILSDLCGGIKAECSFPTADYLQSGLLERIAMEAELLMKRANIREEEVLGLGAGVPGITNTVNGVVVEAPSLNWRDYPFIAEAKKHFNYPIYVDNDVNAAALGEQWLGKAKEKQNVLFIAVGTGIGSGIIINNQLYRGSSSAAGEIGYMVTDKDRLKNNFRPVFHRYGFLESVAGGKSIGDRFAAAVGEREDHPLRQKMREAGLTAEDAFQAAQAGDSLAASVVEEAAEHLSYGIVNAASLLNPEIIILGGGVSKSADQVLPIIRRLVNQYLPTPVDIHTSQLGENAGVLGAVSLFLREHESIIQFS